MKNIPLVFPTKFSFLFLLSAFILACSNTPEKNDIELIKKQMKVQEECWSAGDVDCFMQYYWHSDSLKFIGKNGITYGWQDMLNQYKKSYPNKDAMGILTFKNLHYKKMGNNFIAVVGKWHLERLEGDLEGYYSLIWEKMDGKWLIITDHSS